MCVRKTKEESYSKFISGLYMLMHTDDTCTNKREHVSPNTHTHTNKVK